MNDQTILTDYFSVAKSSQRFQAAKRRKIVTERGTSLQNGSSKHLNATPIPNKPDGKTKLSAFFQRTKDCVRTRKTRNSRNSRTRRNIVPARDLDEVVSCETTSITDDHKLERSRKQGPSSSSVPSRSQGQVNQREKNEVVNSGERDIGSSDKVSADLSQRPNIIGGQQRTGLKVNSWISEQATEVLASRGKRVLNKSFERNQLKDSPTKKSIAKPQPKEKEMSMSGRSVGSVNKPKASIPRLHEGISAPSQKLSFGMEERLSGYKNSISAIDLMEGKSKKWWPANYSKPEISCTEPDSGLKLPAHKRFSYLLEAKEPKAPGITQSLPLPYHYKVLEEMFRCVDVVLSLKQKRYETCTFDKLKESVQEMCRKKFERKHLAQMKTVYPTAFVFRQQSGFHGRKKSEFQLTVDFNLTNFETDQKKGHHFIESSVLIARQKHFKKELLEITKRHHHNYLVKSHPTLSLDNAAVVRWHPCFRLDEVPDVIVSPLPEPPQVESYTTAQDVLDKACQNMAPRVEKSLNLVAKKSKESNAVGEKGIPSKKDLPFEIQNPSLKGISQSLIEKIRQKEEKKIQESLTADPLLVQKNVMMQRLPELCRILKTYFVSERKAAIPLEDASNKLAESYTSSLSSVQVEKHLKLLSELAPEWLSIMYVRKCPYVKLKKNVNINNLIEQLKSKEIN